MWGHGVQVCWSQDSYVRLVHTTLAGVARGAPLLGLDSCLGPPRWLHELPSGFPTLLSGLHALLSGLLTLLSELPTLLSVRVKGHAVLLPDHVAKAHQQGYMQLPSGLHVLLSGLHGLPSGLPTLLS